MKFRRLVASPKISRLPIFLTVSLLLAPFALAADAADTNLITPARMQAIYDEVKTPFKYGVVLEPPPGKKVDCPNVFRHGDKWYMLYVVLEENPRQGYTTQLAESDDLLHWRPRGMILPRGETNAWDCANAGGGVALFDPRWGGSNALQQHAGRYWLSYLGGRIYGYEKTPLAIGLASTEDCIRPQAWEKIPAPVLQPSDADARPLETETLYKSYIFRDETKTLGAPYVMFYNAKPVGGSERIFTAVSADLKQWKRFGSGPVIENLPAPELKRGGISGDPQVVRLGDEWVMFYFGAFWKTGAFDTFAVSRDLVHWTKWQGADLIKASEPYDTSFAHKPWLIKHDGVVYHFYCAVGGQDQHRTIALATSKDFRGTTPSR
ncbi:MAG: hypothetical protein RL380_566 [Verrucomicrobiota bacterium]|jgi:predicted GH43/DUF377 family glycosyl hydrolase